jgi:hypothetical protein
MVNIDADGGTPPMQPFYSEIVEDVRPSTAMEPTHDPTRHMQLRAASAYD